MEDYFYPDIDQGNELLAWNKAYAKLTLKSQIGKAIFILNKMNAPLQRKARYFHTSLTLFLSRWSKEYTNKVNTTSKQSNSKPC